MIPNTMKPPMWLHTVLAHSTFVISINEPYLLKLNSIWPGPSAICDHSHMSRPFSLGTGGSWLESFWSSAQMYVLKDQIDKTAKTMDIYTKFHFY